MPERNSSDDLIEFYGINFFALLQINLLKFIRTGESDETVGSAELRKRADKWHSSRWAFLIYDPLLR